MTAKYFEFKFVSTHWMCGRENCVTRKYAMHAKCNDAVQSINITQMHICVWSCCSHPFECYDEHEIGITNKNKNWNDPNKVRGIDNETVFYKLFIIYLNAGYRQRVRYAYAFFETKQTQSTPACHRACTQSSAWIRKIYRHIQHISFFFGLRRSALTSSTPIIYAFRCKVQLRAQRVTSNRIRNTALYRPRSPVNNMHTS